MGCEYVDSSSILGGIIVHTRIVADFCFSVPATLKVGQGQRISSLTEISRRCTCSVKMVTLAQFYKELLRTQEFCQTPDEQTVGHRVFPCLPLGDDRDS